jgi:hypothetical protein
MNGGLSLPPGRIVNVAGTRTLVEPPDERAAVEPRVDPVADGLLVAVLVGELVVVLLLVVAAVAAEDELVVCDVDAALEECFELPQAPKSTAMGRNMRNRVRRLTGLSIDAD